MYQGSIFICAFNCHEYVGDCIQSLESQVNQDFSIIFIDDASTDETFDVAKKLLTQIFPNRHKIIKNQVNLGKAANAYKYIGEIDSTYTAILDGDDKLVDNLILQDYAKEYNRNFDVVYSNYITSDGRLGHCGPLDPTLPPRLQGWKTSHFFSFRTNLIRNVPIEYFQMPNQDWIKSACDFSIAFPILDQTRRYKFIPRHAYHYTSTSPNNHHNKNGFSQNLNSLEQQENAKIILKKPALECINLIEESG